MSCTTHTVFRISTNFFACFADCVFGKSCIYSLNNSIAIDCVALLDEYIRARHHLACFIPPSIAFFKCGIDFYNNNILNGWSIWKYKIQKTSIIDIGYVYILVIPLFFIASCFEFLSTWNI